MGLLFFEDILSGKHNYIKTQEWMNRFGTVNDELYIVGFNWSDVAF